MKKSDPPEKKEADPFETASLFNECFPDAMETYTLCVFVDQCMQFDYLELRILQYVPKCQRGIFASAPTHTYGNLLIQMRNHSGQYLPRKKLFRFLRNRRRSYFLQH